MRMIRITNNRYLLAIILLVSVSISGCSSTRDRLWLDAEGWRRAVLAGTTILSDQASYTLDNQGNAYFFLVEEISDGYSPRIVGLTRNAEEFTNVALDLVLDVRPRDTGIYWDGANLNLFWIENHKFVRLVLDENFNGEPQMLSDGVWVSNYAVAVGSDGKIVIWYSGDRSQPSLYSILYEDGVPQSILVDINGYRPSLQFDNLGQLHAIWARKNTISANQRVYYGVYAGGVFQKNIEALIYQIPSSTTDRVEGPNLGLDANNGYLIWSVVHNSGLQAGIASADYAYFPLGKPQEISTPIALVVPRSTDLTYSEPINSGFNVGDRVSFSNQTGGQTSNLTDISIISGSAAELAISVRARLPHLRNQERIQVGVLYLNEGNLNGYQLISYTIANSIKPMIIKDMDNHLYLTWIESNSEDFNVFYSSTSPDIKTALKGVSSSEALSIAAEMSFGMFSSMLLIYFPLMWMFVPGLVMLVTSTIRRADEPLMSIGTIISLVLSIATYWFAKLFFLPDILTYTPFTTYIPMIPTAWYLTIRISIISLFTLIAGYVAWKYTYGTNRRSPFFTILIFMAIDGLFTMAIYGGAVYSAL